MVMCWGVKLDFSGHCLSGFVFIGSNQSYRKQNRTNFLACAGEYSFENLRPLQLFCIFWILAAITLSVIDGCVKNTPKLSNFKQQSCSCFALFSFFPTRPSLWQAPVKPSLSLFHLGSAGATHPGAGRSPGNMAQMLGCRVGAACLLVAQPGLLARGSGSLYTRPSGAAGQNGICLFPQAWAQIATYHHLHHGCWPSSEHVHI